MQKIRIGVLMGGKSLEKEVSFNTGRTVCDYIDTTQYSTVPLYQTGSKIYLLPWHFLHRGKTTDFEHRLATEATYIAWDDLKKHVDFWCTDHNARIPHTAFKGETPLEKFNQSWNTNEEIRILVRHQEALKLRLKHNQKVFCEICEVA